LVPLLWLLPASIPSCLSPSSTLVADGNRLFREGKVEDAIAYYSLAISIDSSCGEALLNRGVARELLGASYEALKDYDRAVSISTVSTNAIVYGMELRLALYEQARSRRDAIGNQPLISLEAASIEAVLERDIDRMLRGSQADGYAFRARFRFLQKRFEEAAADFTKVVHQDYYDPWGYNERGRCLFELGDDPAAIADFSKAIHLDGTNGGYFYNRALALEKVGRDHEAEMDYGEAVRLDSSDAWAYYKRGNLRSKRGDGAGGRDDIKRAQELGISLDPDEQRK
jgi:tetratricopeptide (TPR) repeat protein